MHTCASVQFFYVERGDNKFFLFLKYINLYFQPSLFEFNKISFYLRFGDIFLKLGLVSS